MRNETTNNTQALLEKLMQQAEEHKTDIEAYYAAHPEEAERRKNMTKAEIIEEILNALEKLGLIKEPTPEEKAAEQKYTELRSLLHFQYISFEYNGTLIDYVQREQSRPDYSEAFLFWDIFNYGRICGKREERARKKNSI